MQKENGTIMQKETSETSEPTSEDPMQDLGEIWMEDPKQDLGEIRLEDPKQDKDGQRKRGKRGGRN